MTITCEKEGSLMQVSANLPTDTWTHEAAIRIARHCRHLIQACLREEEWADADREFYRICREEMAGFGQPSPNPKEGRKEMSDSSVKPGVDWRGADLRGVNMAGVTLQHADLRATSLAGVNFTGSDLSYADFRGANVQGAVFQNASLYGAKMQGITAQQADFRGADLRQANLGGAYLEGAMLPATDKERLPSPSEIARQRGQDGPERENGRERGR